MSSEEFDELSDLPLLPAGSSLDQRLHQLEVRLVLLNTRHSNEIAALHREFIALRSDFGTAVAHLSELQRYSKATAEAVRESAETAAREAEHRREREKAETSRRIAREEAEAEKELQREKAEAEEKARADAEASKWWTWVRATVDKPLGLFLLAAAMYSVGKCTPPDLTTSAAPPENVSAAVVPEVSP